jgi:hypothetical protein
MKFFKIEIDEELWNFLKRNAEPFEDTPNSVLRRLLLPEFKKGEASTSKSNKEEISFEIPSSVPKALSQFLEVIYGIRKLGQDRRDATRAVAKREGVFYQTIIDKYCRQLGRKAYEIDVLLESENLSELQSLLEKKFPYHRDIVNNFFKSLS